MSWTLRALGAAAILFGIVTVAEGGRTLFGGPEARAAAGAYVPFVLWFNFLAGFAYISAGAGLVASCRWATGLALAIAVATLLVFGAFGLHVAQGGAYEPRTAAALTLRTGFWALTAWLALRHRAAAATTRP
jgi:hypothetical protein